LPNAAGFGDDLGRGIAVDSSGHIYVAGTTDSPDFPTVNAIQPRLQGFENAFVLKLVNGPDFHLTAYPDVAEVSAGQNAAYTLTLTPQNGFNQTISFTCSGAPAGSTCHISPASLTLNGVDPATATVTVTTRASLSRLLTEGQYPEPPTGSFSEQASPAMPILWITALLAVVSGIYVGGALQRFRRVCRILLGFLLLSFLTYCGNGNSGGGGGGPGTLPGTYTLTAMATSQDGLRHPAGLTLVVH
jgi:hypothetical protein